MRCAVFGAGYVGLTTAVVLAERGHPVVLHDLDSRKLAEVKAGRAPFSEPGLDSSLRRLVRVGVLRTSDTPEEALGSAQAVFVCVGTPSAPSGDADLSFLRAAAATIAAAVPTRPRRLMVIIKSTVPPGTCEKIVAPILARRRGAVEGRNFEVVACPEFLREGRALADARRPDRVVVGARAPEVARLLRRVLAVEGSPYLITSRTVAEAIKYASNAFLALKISFANEFARLAEELGIDVYAVMEGVGLDRRIGPQFLGAGAGFGGSCFPKDVRAFAALAEQRGLPARLANAVLELNEEQPIHVVALAERSGALAGRRVALLGLAFKPDTDDVRESRAFAMFGELRRRKATVVCWDPVATANFRKLQNDAECTSELEEALQGCDVAIIQTEWRQLRDLPARRWKALMRGKLVVDGRRAVAPEVLREAGVGYIAVGDGGSLVGERKNVAAKPRNRNRNA